MSVTSLHFIECEKPSKKRMAWDSFNSIEDFGYKFNEGLILLLESKQHSCNVNVSNPNPNLKLYPNLNIKPYPNLNLIQT